jgi:Flp pilus assembly protein TadD
VSQKHAQAIAHYEAGRFVEAIRLLEVLLMESPTSDLWNDWATAQLANGDAAKANAGFAQALAIDPGNHAAAINHGVLLCTTAHNSPRFSRTYPPKRNRNPTPARASSTSS